MDDLSKRTKGRVYAYTGAANTGVIITEDGNKYLFTKKDWLSEQFPVTDLNVLFIMDYSWARSIKVEQ